MSLIGNEYPKPVGRIGDVERSYSSPGPEYLTCDGSAYPAASYPELSEFFDVSPLSVRLTISDMKYAGVSVGLPYIPGDGIVYGIATNSDGTRIWYLSGTNGDIIEADMTNPGDTKTIKATGNFFNVFPQEASPRAMHFNADCSKFWVVGSAKGVVYQYDCPTPGSLVGAVYSGISVSVSTQDSYPESVFINDAGTRMWVHGIITKSVYEYDLPTPGTVAGATYTNRSLALNEREGSPQCLKMSPDAKKLWVLGSNRDSIEEFDLPTPGTIAGAAYSKSFSVSNQNQIPISFEYNYATKRLFLFGLTPQRRLYAYSLPEVQTGGEFVVPSITSTPTTYIKAL